MRARGVLTASAVLAAVWSAAVWPAPASAQIAPTVMYIRPPRAVLCDRLDHAKIAVEIALEAMQTRRPARPYPAGCHAVKPNLAVVVLDRFDDIAYVDVDAAPLPRRLWVHVGALSPAPERPPPRRPR